MSGRLAASDSVAMRSMCSSSKAPTVGMNSIVVPGWSRTAPARVTSSSVVAERDGTGLPSPSLWVGARDDEKPSPPAVSDSWSTRTMAASCSSEASEPTAASPVTARRTAE